MALPLIATIPAVIDNAPYSLIVGGSGIVENWASTGTNENGFFFSSLANKGTYLSLPRGSYPFVSFWDSEVGAPYANYWQITRLTSRNKSTAYYNATGTPLILSPAPSGFNVDPAGGNSNVITLPGGKWFASYPNTALTIAISPQYGVQTMGQSSALVPSSRFQGQSYNIYPELIYDVNGFPWSGYANSTISTSGDLYVPDDVNSVRGLPNASLNLALGYVSTEVVGAKTVYDGAHFWPYSYVFNSPEGVKLGAQIVPPTINGIAINPRHTLQGDFWDFGSTYGLPNNSLVCIRSDLTGYYYIPLSAGDGVDPQYLGSLFDFAYDPEGYLYVNTKSNGYGISNGFQWIGVTKYPVNFPPGKVFKHFPSTNQTPNGHARYARYSRG